jgi:hypothetical protein
LLHRWGPRGCYTVETAPVLFMCSSSDILHLSNPIIIFSEKSNLIIRNSESFVFAVTCAERERERDSSRLCGIIICVVPALPLIMFSFQSAKITGHIVTNETQFSLVETIRDDMERSCLQQITVASGDRRITVVGGRARRQQGALPWKLGSVRSLLRDS